MLVGMFLKSYAVDEKMPDGTNEIVAAAGCLRVAVVAGELYTCKVPPLTKCTCRTCAVCLLMAARGYCNTSSPVYSVIAVTVTTWWSPL